MSEGKDTPTQQQENESVRRGHIRPVEAALVSMIAMIASIAGFFLAGYIENGVGLWISRNLTVLVFIGSIVWLGRIAYDYEWTGFGEAELPKPEWVRPKKTLWDWLQLLLVPLLAVALTAWFTAQQETRQQELEKQRADDAALQAYLNQMSTVLLGKELRSSTGASKEARTLARARTLAVMGSLGPV